mmetsp:Transcript_41250/g.124732  ORF Transcript_41250/g.124732 Transcript_41250/m.124732 type:complete len:233 (+) Transcript_41250:1848-2546(+)
MLVALEDLEHIEALDLQLGGGKLEAAVERLDVSLDLLNRETVDEGVILLRLGALLGGHSGGGRNRLRGCHPRFARHDDLAVGVGHTRGRGDGSRTRRHRRAWRDSGRPRLRRGDRRHGSSGLDGCSSSRAREGRCNAGVRRAAVYISPLRSRMGMGWSAGGGRHPWSSWRHRRWRSRSPPLGGQGLGGRPGRCLVLRLGWGAGRHWWGAGDWGRRRCVGGLLPFGVWGAHCH